MALASSNRQQLLLSNNRIVLHAWFFFSILALSLCLCCWALLDNNEQPINERHTDAVLNPESTTLPSALLELRGKNDLKIRRRKNPICLPLLYRLLRPNKLKVSLIRASAADSDLNRIGLPTQLLVNSHAIESLLLTGTAAALTPDDARLGVDTSEATTASASPEQIHSFEEWRALQLKLQQEQQQQAAVTHETIVLPDDDRLRVLIKHADAVAAAAASSITSTAVPEAIGEKITGVKLPVQSGNGNLQAQRTKSNNKFNYAASKCGARIRNRNAEAKNADAILNSNRDDYMVSACEARKFFTVELCEPIQSHAFEVGSLEFFSSPPKVIRLRGSQYYPATEWIELGSFTLRDERSIQRFDIQSELSSAASLLYVKFIRVDVDEVYRSEHFCPISMFRFYGASFVDEYNSVVHQQNGEPTIEENKPNVGEDAVDEDEVEHMRAVGKKGSKKTRGDEVVVQGGTNAGGKLETVAESNGKHKKDFVENVKDAVISLVKHAADVVMPAKSSSKTFCTVPAVSSNPEVIDGKLAEFPMSAASSRNEPTPFGLLVDQLHVSNRTESLSMLCVDVRYGLVCNDLLPPFERLSLIIRQQCSTRRMRPIAAMTKCRSKPQQAEVVVADLPMRSSRSQLLPSPIIFSSDKTEADILSVAVTSLPNSNSDDEGRSSDAVIASSIARSDDSQSAGEGGEEQEQQYDSPSTASNNKRDIFPTKTIADQSDDVDRLTHILPTSTLKLAILELPSELVSAVDLTTVSSSSEIRSVVPTVTATNDYVASSAAFAQTIDLVAASTLVASPTLSPPSPHADNSLNDALFTPTPSSTEETMTEQQQRMKPPPLLTADVTDRNTRDGKDAALASEVAPSRHADSSTKKAVGESDVATMQKPQPQMPATPVIILPYVAKPPVLIPAAAVQQQHPQQQVIVAEPSILMLISNRLRTLELNVSLTSTYLEDLSRRYRKLTEDINKKQNSSNEMMRAADEQREMLEQWLMRLQNKFDHVEMDVQKQRELLQPFYKRNMSLQYIVLMFIGFSLFTIFLAVVLVQSSRAHSDARIEDLQWQLAEMRQQVAALQQQQLFQQQQSSNSSRQNSTAALRDDANANMNSSRTSARPASASASFASVREADLHPRRRHVDQLNMNLEPNYEEAAAATTPVRATTTPEKDAVSGRDEAENAFAHNNDAPVNNAVMAAAHNSANDSNSQAVTDGNVLYAVHHAAPNQNHHAFVS